MVRDCAPLGGWSSKILTSAECGVRENKQLQQSLPVLFLVQECPLSSLEQSYCLVSHF